MQMVPMGLLRANHQAQPRAHMSQEIVEQYQNDMAEGAEFPPITVFHDGSLFWIADGFHRHLAAVGLGLPEMACEVREGGLRDAVLFSCSANATHGQRRTNEDKRRAVERLLADPEWNLKSDHLIARQCAVSQPFVSGLRPTLSDNGYQIDQPRLVERGGTVYEQKTAGINAQRASRAPERQAYNPDPDNGGAVVLAVEDFVRAAISFGAPEDAFSRVPSKMSRRYNSDQIRMAGDWLHAFASEMESKSRGAA